ncbi:MAG TPA: hypothetical protein VEL76_13445 [Gemmataceae bacterium]|nr:hypothetical protein [Gemmataceae bacterium]
MILSESQTQKPDREAPLPHPLAEEIERALEMVRRVKRAREAQGAKDVRETRGNTYVLPEPLVFRVSESTHGH